MTQQAMDCPLCWQRRREVQRLRRVGLGQWQCVVCECEVLAGERDMPKPAVVREKYPQGDKAPRVKKWGGGGSSGRRRKKPQKPKRWYQGVIE